MEYLILPLAYSKSKLACWVDSDHSMITCFYSHLYFFNMVGSVLRLTAPSLTLQSTVVSSIKSASLRWQFIVKVDYLDAS